MFRGHSFGQKTSKQDTSANQRESPPNFSPSPITQMEVIPATISDQKMAESILTTPPVLKSSRAYQLAELDQSADEDIFQMASSPSKQGSKVWSPVKGYSNVVGDNRDVSYFDSSVGGRVANSQVRPQKRVKFLLDERH